MIETATSLNTKSGKELLDQSGNWNRYADRSCCILDEIQIFEMEIDFEARRKITIEYFVRFLLETLAAGEAAAEGADHLLRIDAGLGAKHQSLSNCCEIDGDDNLICQFRETAGTERSHVRDCLSQRIKHG